MLLETCLIRKYLFAELRDAPKSLPRLLVFMNHIVLLEVRPTPELLVTKRAAVGLLTRVDASVSDEVGDLNGSVELTNLPARMRVCTL